ITVLISSIRMYVGWIDASSRQSYKLPDGETTIGRRPGCQIFLSNIYVSRRHAQIIGSSDKYTITDLESTYGTFVNGTQITERVLEDGDRIELGRDRVPLLISLDAPKFPGEEATGLELEKLSWILDFQVQWGTTFTLETAFDQILRSALKLSGAERAFILNR